MTTETKTEIVYETVNRPGYPGLPEMYLDDGVFYHADRRTPIDFESLVALGYLRRVRVTTTKEYL